MVGTFYEIFSKYGGIHKLRWQARGRGGFSQMLTWVYVLNFSTKGEGGQKSTKSCQRSLWMPPIAKHLSSSVYLVKLSYKPSKHSQFSWFSSPIQKGNNVHCKYWESLCNNEAKFTFNEVGLVPIKFLNIEQNEKN